MKIQLGICLAAFFLAGCNDDNKNEGDAYAPEVVDEISSVERTRLASGKWKIDNAHQVGGSNPDRFHVGDKLRIREVKGARTLDHDKPVAGAESCDLSDFIAYAERCRIRDGMAYVFRPILGVCPFPERTIDCSDDVDCICYFFDDGNNGPGNEYGTGGGL